MLTYDAIIIGAGQSGTPLALKLAAAGVKTALVEKRAIGGTCINDGCTPTKTLIASAAQAYNIAHAARLGITVDSFSIDFNQIMRRKDEIVEQFRKGSETAIEKAKHLVLFKGEACFTGPKEIVVKLDSSMEAMRAENIFIDAGMEPDVPLLDGLDEVPFFTSSSILNITECPPALLVLGGNYTGVEMAQLFSRLGSKVTIVEKNEQLLPKEDPDIAEAVRALLEAEGIQVYTDAAVQSVKGMAPVLTLLSDGKQQRIGGSHLLVTTGRKPQTAALDLEKAGIAVDDKGFIQVDEYLCTRVPGVYALGDIKGGPAFTHVSYNDYVVVYENLMEGTHHSYFDRQVPYCMFTNPQLGRVGLTETAAIAAGIDIEVAKLPMDKSSRGIETAQTEGLMKAVVEKASGKILGVAILSAEGGEVMSVLQMAMAGGFTADQLQKHIFAHPLFSESINNLFMS